jgi:inorganic pyrophosphatase
LAADLNDIDDVERHMPGAINAVRTYFTNYKSWDGCINEFALNAQAMPRAFAHMIIERVHQQWRTLHLRDKIHTV